VTGEIEVIFESEIPEEVRKVLRSDAEIVLGYFSPKRVKSLFGIPLIPTEIISQIETKPTIIIDRLLKWVASHYFREEVIYKVLTMVPTHEFIHSLSRIHDEKKVHLITNRMVFGDEIADRIVRNGYEGLK